MSNEKFCRICGKEKVAEMTGLFDADTGEQTFRTICVDDCKHGNHGWIVKEGPSWTLGLFGTKYICDKCGCDVSAE